MGLKYRGWAVALTAGLLMAWAGAAAVLAGEPTSDVVMDGVVTVAWVELDDGPMAGASILISYYHEGDAIPGLLPAATTNSEGVVVITGVPRAAEGALPLLLDIRGDRSTATVDNAGCTTHEGWLAETTGVASDLALDVVLAAATKSISVSCPEPTPTPDSVEPTPTPDPEPTPTPDVVQPTPTATPTGGGVLGAVGTPGVTPPETDAVAGPTSPTGSPAVPILLVLAALAVFLVPAAALAYAGAHSQPRPRQR